MKLPVRAKTAIKEKSLPTPSGNRTRVSPVAGEYSTTRPTVCGAVMHAQFDGKSGVATDQEEDSTAPRSDAIGELHVRARTLPRLSRKRAVPTRHVHVCVCVHAGTHARLHVCIPAHRCFNVACLHQRAWERKEYRMHDEERCMRAHVHLRLTNHTCAHDLYACPRAACGHGYTYPYALALDSRRTKSCPLPSDSTRSGGSARG